MKDYFAINLFNNDVREEKLELEKEVLENWFDIFSNYFNTLAYYDEKNAIYYVSKGGIFTSIDIEKSTNDIYSSLLKEIQRIDSERKVNFVRTRYDSSINEGLSVFTAYYSKVEDKNIYIYSKYGVRFIAYASFIKNSLEEDCKYTINILGAPDSENSTLHVFKANNFAEYFNITDMQDINEIAAKMLRILAEQPLSCR